MLIIFKSIFFFFGCFKLFPLLAWPKVPQALVLDRFRQSLREICVLELKRQQPHDPDPGHEEYLPAVPNPKQD